MKRLLAMGSISLFFIANATFLFTSGIVGRVTMALFSEKTENGVRYHKPLVYGT